MICSASMRCCQIAGSLPIRSIAFLNVSANPTPLSAVDASDVPHVGMPLTHRLMLLP